MFPFRSPLFEESGEGASGGGGSGSGAGSPTIFGGASDGGSSQQQQEAAGGAAAGVGGGAAWSWTKDETGTLNEGWQDKLGDELKANPSLRTFSSLPDLAKAYVETKGLVGKRLEMPGEGATPEQVAFFRKVTGAPEKPEGYRGDAKNLKPADLPDELWDAKGEDAFLAVAHKHHLPPAAVKDIFDLYGKTLMDSVKQSQGDEAAMVTAETEKLRGTWGKEFDANLHSASRMAQTIGLDPKSDPIFTKASYVEAFAKMAKLVSEDKLVAGEQPSLMNAAQDRVRDMQDTKSQSVLAREYRGEFGPERQAAAQTQLHQLMATLQQK